jgi:hypothetical protein
MTAGWSGTLVIIKQGPDIGKRRSFAIERGSVPGYLQLLVTRCTAITGSAPLKWSPLMCRTSLDDVSGIKWARGADFALRRGMGVPRDRRSKGDPDRNSPVVSFQRPEKAGHRHPARGRIGIVSNHGRSAQRPLSAIDEPRKRCSVVVASILVNPIQFNHRSDYALYPRVFDEDVAFCDTRAVDYIFAPPDDEMYPQPQRVFVEVGADDSQC